MTYEDVLNTVRESTKRSGNWDRAFQHKVDAMILALAAERLPPGTDPQATLKDIFTGAEMAEIVREAEVKAIAFMEDAIQKMARELYSRFGAASPGADTTQ